MSIVVFTSNTCKMTPNDQEGKIKEIVIKTPEGFEYYDYDDIIRFEANLNRTIIHLATSTKPTTALCNLATIEKRLDYNNYLRCHKSHIINLQYVSKYVTSERILFMDDKSKVPVSHNRHKVITKLSTNGTLLHS